MRAAAFLLLWVSALTWGAPTPTGTLSEDVSPGAPSFGVDLYSWTYSNPFSQWNGQTATVDGAEGGPIQIVNQITLHSPAFGPFDFELTPQIVLQPMQGERFQLLDPSAGIEGTLIEANGFTYWVRIEALLPITAVSRDEGMILGPQTSHSLDYRFPGGRWMLSLSLTPTVRIYNDRTTNLQFYFSPRLAYVLTDSLWLVGLAEGTWQSERGTSIFRLMKQGEINLGLGMRYTMNAGEGFWLQPFLGFFPAGSFASNAHLGLFFGGALL